MTSTNVPKYEKSYTESQAVEFIKKAISKLKELENSSDFQLVHQTLQNVSTSYFDLKTHKIPMCEELLKQNYVPTVTQYITKFHKMGYFVNDDVWFATYYALNGLWNYSDGFQNLANAILQTDLPKLLMGHVLHKPYIDGLQSTNIYYIMKSSVSIIHNIIRNPGNEGVFRIDEFKKVLLGLIHRNGSDFLGIISMMTLAILVNENELHLLEEGENTIRTLIKQIRNAFESSTKRINGFAIWELVNGLRCVSANDNMKKTIVKESGIKLIFDIIKQPSCDDDVEKCLGLIWNLCFDKDIRTVIVNEFDLRNVIKQFDNHKSQIIKKCIDGISWLIDNKAQSKQRLKSASVSRIEALKKNWKFDLFLSYSWANKSTVLSIRDELVKSKINVWIDLDQMKGSTLEAMADGIENSELFVMAISDAYRTSPNCRTEAEYAFSLKKPTIPLIVELKYKPTGWLGLIMGSKMYYEFSERRNFTESIKGLLDNIDALMIKSDTSVVVKHTVPLESDFVDSGVSNRDSNMNSIANVNAGKSNIRQWTNKDVEDWLIKNGLGHMKSKFSLLDGKLLSSMVNMNSKCPDYLFETLKTEYGMKLIDILKINLAFKEINL